MSNDAIKSIIEDAHKLAKADIAPDLVKPAVETIALRLERLVKDGLYITPKKVIEAVAGARPLDAIFKDPPPEMAAAEEKKSYLELPRDITLTRYVMGDRSVMFVGQYFNKAGKPSDKPVRLYRIEVRKDKLSGNWHFAIWEDNLLCMSGASMMNRAVTEYSAIKALKAVLNYKVRNCKKAHRQRKAAEQNKEVA